MFRSMLFVLIVSVISTPLFAADAPAPAAPSSQPAAPAASQPVRLAPKDVEKAFIQALCDGDFDKARSYTLTWIRANEMLEGRAAFYQSWGAFEAACAKAFGGPTTQPGKPSTLAQRHFEAIDAARERAEGDLSIIVSREEPARIELRREGGVWKIDPRTVYGNRTGEYQPAVFSGLKRKDMALAKARNEV